MGDIIDDEKWQGILEHYDTNQDGKLSKKEFIKLLSENVESYVKESSSEEK